jgi:hypothetical protein
MSSLARNTSKSLAFLASPGPASPTCTSAGTKAAATLLWSAPSGGSWAAAKERLRNMRMLPNQSIAVSSSTGWASRPNASA